MMLIGITGKKRSGKSSLANILVENWTFKRLRFADPLKTMLKSLGLTDEHVDGNLKEQPCMKLGGLTPRHAMQTLGTEWGRDCMGSDFWIRQWENSLPLGDVVADDLRFANEAAAIRQRGGVVVKVVRPGLDSKDSHASENDDVPFDIAILNNRGLKELEQAITRVHAALKGELPPFKSLKDLAVVGGPPDCVA